MPKDFVAVPVARGYFGRCGDSMCTSPNGWWWQTPADPSIFQADATALFTPEWYVRRPGGGWVVMAWEGIWYSLDGVHWQLSSGPDPFYGWTGLAVGPDGFALTAFKTNMSSAGCQLYVSQDGATWRDGGEAPCVDYAFLGARDRAGGILGMANSGRYEGQYIYSADGRTWVPASIPGVLASGNPYRLSDGSLVVLSIFGPPIISTDGGMRWTILTRTGGWNVEEGSNNMNLNLVVVRDRVLVQDGDVTWESSDRGDTFHEMARGLGFVGPMGDVAFAEKYGEGASVDYVGAPLAPSEMPGTTATSTGLPVPSMTPGPTPTPQPQPTGGISRAEAMRISDSVIHPSAVERKSSRASLTYSDDYRRWIWEIGYTTTICGNLCGYGHLASVDFYTGEILSFGDWIS